MRKFILSIIIVSALVLSLSCSPGSARGEDSSSTSYKCDSSSHWKKDDRSDREKHSSELVRTEEKTEDGDIILERRCPVCSYVIETLFEHPFDEKSWKYDDAEHYRVSTCSHKVEERGVHKTERETSASCLGKGQVTSSCSLCGYSKTQVETGNHSFGSDDICTICHGYRCGDYTAAVFDKDERRLNVRGAGAVYDYTRDQYRAWSNLEFNTLIVEDGVTRIGDYAFYCAKITSLTIGKDVRSIGSHALAYTQLKTISFDDGAALRETGDHAFYYNKELESVTLPSSMKVLGSYSFDNCSALRSITLNEGLEEIRNGAFSGTGIEKLHLPSTLNPGKDNGSSVIAFWSEASLTELTVDKKNPYVNSEDGVLYSKDGKTVVAVPAGKTDVTIPDEVETISREAFSSWTGSEITLPTSVRTIEKQAFKMCSNLVSVNIGSGIETIAVSAFDYTPFKAGKLTITIDREEKSVEGYEDCWREYGDKEIEIVWTKKSGS